MSLYHCQRFRVSLKIIHRAFLEIIKDDILRFEENTGDIQYRWSPLHPDITSNQQIIVYFYWKSNISSNSVRYCFKKRFGATVLSSSYHKIRCPSNVPVTSLCMLCNKRKCTDIKYRLISIPNNCCTQCQQRININIINIDNDQDDEKKEAAFNDYIRYDYGIKNDPDSKSFEFQLIMHQEFIQIINPSIRSKTFLKHKVIKRIGKRSEDENKFDILPIAFQKAYKKLIWYNKDIKTDPDIKTAIGVLNSHSNQLIRDHKAYIINNQVKKFNFVEDKEIMQQIEELIDNGQKTADSWFESIPLLRDTLFDLMYLIKELVKHKFNLTDNLMNQLIQIIVDKDYESFRLFPKYITRNWRIAIKSAMILDCDSPYRRRKSLNNATMKEQEITEVLNDNNVENKTQYELLDDIKHDVRKGTPDNLLIKHIPISGKYLYGGTSITLKWIDVKYECCCITTEHRNKLKRQIRRYNKNIGVGALIFANGYIEDLNIGENVVIMSQQWFNTFIGDITDYTKKDHIVDVSQFDGDNDDDDNDDDDFDEYPDDINNDSDDLFGYNDDSSDNNTFIGDITDYMKKDHIVGDNDDDDDDIDNDSDDSKDGIQCIENNDDSSDNNTDSWSMHTDYDPNYEPPLPPIRYSNGDNYNNNNYAITETQNMYHHNNDNHHKNGNIKSDQDALQPMVGLDQLRMKVIKYNGKKKTAIFDNINNITDL